MMQRVLIGGLFHEGNSFSKALTRGDKFTVVEGADVLTTARTSGAGLGGACRFLMQQDVELVAYRKATASPDARVADDFYFEFRDGLLKAAAAARPDCVYFELHGAMLTSSLDDAEGDLLSSLRAALGDKVIIAVSLDLHAYVTRTMLTSADIVVACKENPHSDFHLAGELAARLMLQKRNGTLRPVTAAVWVPLFVGSQMETAKGPLSRLHTLRRKMLAANPSVLDISIYNTQTLIDVADGGHCITVITDNDEVTAREVATSLARELWSMRDEFTPDNPPLAKVLDDLEQGRLARPVILGDGGDNALAGTAGDGTFMLNEFLTRRPHLRAAVPVADPDVVSRAKKAGKGNTFSACVGGKFSDDVAPVCAEWSVEHLSDGRFVQAGPFLANEPADFGDTAVLSRDNVTVLVTTRSGFTQDVAAFRSQGIEPANYDAIVVKSNHHYKLSFAEVGPCITVDTPGISNMQSGTLPFVKRRPIYPLDRIIDPDLTATVINPRG